MTTITSAQVKASYAKSNKNTWMVGNRTISEAARPATALLLASLPEVGWPREHLILPLLGNALQR